MNDLLQFIAHHGPLVLFTAVLLEQLGLPLPAAPVLLTAGALASTAALNPIASVIAAASACLIADLIWFQLGRAYGNRILGLLCRISIEPDTCIRKTEDLFKRYGSRVIVTAKFIPGLSLVMPPLAAVAKVPPGRFLLFDGLGSVLYAGSYVLLGFVFRDQLLQIVGVLSGLGHGIAVLLVLVVAYLAFKWIKRSGLLSRFDVPRVSAEGLYELTRSGVQPLVIDLRSDVELTSDPFRIPGAWHVPFAELEIKAADIPKAREVVLYCKCPGEAGSARAARRLRKHGITRARPLARGLDGWRERNYALEPINVAAASNVSEDISFVTSFDGAAAQAAAGQLNALSS